mgnify:CR=1 FL=1
MAQQEIFYSDLADRLVSLGYNVKRFTEYQFRVNDRVDVYPVNRRWHDIKENKRGDYEDIFAFCEKFFKENSTMPVMILDLKKEMKDMPKNTPIIRRYERPHLSSMILSEGEARAINEALTEQHILATRHAQENMWTKIQEIKNLPWWKRLFKQF